MPGIERELFGADLAGDDEIRVLYADDDPAQLDLTAAQLERRGDVSVETEPEPSVALERLSSEPFDLVLSDYQMPGMDGLELLRRVREEFPDLPFVLYTGKGSEDIASDAISAGVDEYLQKSSAPEQYDVLANRIRNLVRERRARETLRKRERQYRNVLDASPVPIGIYTVDREIIYSNDAGIEFFGAEDPDELLGRDPTEFVHPEDREHAAERIRRVLEDREVVQPAEERFLKVDGGTKTAVVAAGPVEVAGRPAAQVVFNDVSAYRQHARDAQGWGDTLAAALETVGDAVVTVDEDGTLTARNSVLGDLTGRDADGLEETRVTDLLHPEDREPFEAFLERLDDGPTTVEVRFVDDDGDPRARQLAGAAVDPRDEDGTRYCLIVRPPQ